MKINSSAGQIKSPKFLNTQQRFKLLEFAIKLEKMHKRKNAS